MSTISLRDCAIQCLYFMLGEMGMGSLGVRANSGVWLSSGSVWPREVQGLGVRQPVFIYGLWHSPLNILGEVALSLTLNSLPV